MGKGHLIAAVSAALVIGLLVPASAGAVVSTLAYSSTAATLTSDGASDTLVVSDSGGLLSHPFLPTGSGPNEFNSDVDWDSSTLGNQTLANAPTNSLTFNGGAGDDLLQIGLPSQPSSTTLALVGFDGGAAGTDTLSILDSAATASEIVNVFASQVTGLGATRTYSNLETLEVETGHANDAVFIAGTFTTTKTSAFTNAGNDAIGLADGVDTHGGRLDGGNETNGEHGFDTLDYSSWTAPVNVGLGAGTATGTGSIASIENVNGGTVGDVLTGSANPDGLTGNGGADTLDGGAGPDDLTGGPGADTEHGGAGDDIFNWQSSEGSDTIDGDADTAAAGNGGGDLLVVNGSSGADTFTYGPGAGGRMALTAPGPATLDVATIEHLVLDGNPPGPPGPDGNNTITGLPGATGLLDAFLIGGTGNDHLTGGDEPTLLNGDVGNDTLNGGGSQFDIAQFNAPVTADLAAGSAMGEGADTMTNVEGLWGSSGPDNLFGDANSNLVEGFEGNDVLDGRAGEDLASGDDGDDDLRSRDGFADLNACGDGNDTVTADTLDMQEPGACETVLLSSERAPGGDSGNGGQNQTPGPPLVPPVTPPASNPALGVRLLSSAKVAPNGAATIGSITNPPTASASTVLSGTLPAKYQSAFARVAAREAAAFRASGRAKRKPKAKPVTVASGQASAGSGATTKLTVRLGAKARKAVKKHNLRVTATVTARGPDGTTATVTKAITLKRAKAPKRKKR